MDIKSKILNSRAADIGFKAAWLVKRKINRLSKNDDIRVNIGAGRWIRKGWKTLEYYNFWYSDIYMKYADYNHNLMSFNPMPMEDGSVSMLFSSHCLEHIPEKYFTFLFKEFHRILKNGGVIRIAVPDYDILFDDAKKALKKTEPDKKKLQEFFDFFCDFYSTESIGLARLRKDFSAGRESFGNKYLQKLPDKWSNEHPGSHKSWWNYKKMSELLKRAGFSKVYRSAPYQSKFPEFRAKYQFLNMGFDGTHSDDALYVEAVKSL
ncbi:MAG: methyltransferase domain-containing protein [archaeon]